VAAAGAAHGRPADYLILCAGLSNPGYFLEQSVDTFRRQMDLNYFGSLHAVKALVPSLVEAKQPATVVFVSSAAAFCGMVGYSQYCASKFAVRGLADCLRNELLPHKVLFEEQAAAHRRVAVVATAVKPPSPRYHRHCHCHRHGHPSCQEVLVILTGA
jgi:NAD(P)-dependent dehydrogenase (short-subunit alcohol dehydrogenase family)